MQFAIIASSFWSMASMKHEVDALQDFFPNFGEDRQIRARGAERDPCLGQIPYDDPVVQIGQLSPITRQFES